MRAATVVSALIFLSACVSIDSRTWKEKPATDSASAIVGTFSNAAHFRSSGLELAASETLADAFGFQIAGMATVKVSRPTVSELELDFRKPDGPAFVARYVEGKDFTLTPDGRFVIPLRGGCGARDNPGFGCGSKTVTLFINTEGDLAALESGGGAGLLGVIPLVVYARHLVLFRRLE